MTIKNLKNQPFVAIVNNRGAGKPKQSPIFWGLVQRYISLKLLNHLVISLQIKALQLTLIL